MMLATMQIHRTQRKIEFREYLLKAFIFKGKKNQSSINSYGILKIKWEWVHC